MRPSDELPKPESSPSLPADRTFVLQFQAGSERMAGDTSGKVEHLVSGDCTHFGSWSELREFVDRVLRSGGTQLDG